jgi:hypothetical protein
MKSVCFMSENEEGTVCKKRYNVNRKSFSDFNQKRLEEKEGT